LAVKIFGIATFLLFAVNCSTTEPPPPPDGDNPQITLELDDATCTEAWIKLTTTNLQLPTAITLQQNDITQDTINLSSADTLLYTDFLLPNTNYQYQASSIQYQATSNKLGITTMDTTSHERTWQLFKFGEHSHSVLYDVAIIDENNIWAVGEIYLLDSLGNQDPKLYNIAKWNGQAWQFERVYYNYQGSNFLAHFESIFAFTINDVWVGSNQPMHWAGNIWEKWDLLGDVWEGWINKNWGNCNTDFYIVGNTGNVASFKSNKWTSMESGTEVDLLDIFGSEDGTLWTCGYRSTDGISTLLRNNGAGWQTIYEGPGSVQSNGYYIGPLSGVWGTDDKRIYLMNWNGIYIQPNSSELFYEKELARFSSSGYGIDGTDDNNIFVCGVGFVGHWNGATYIEYSELYQQNRRLLSVDVKGNTVCAVGRDYNGFIYSEAVIALSK